MPIKREEVVAALKQVIELRGNLKLLSTYYEAPISSDGRIRCGYKIHGTITGRLSSAKYWDDTGTNLQNIPPEARKCFLPDEGHVFIEADLSQAEARVVAYLAEDETLIRLFTEGGDIHKKVASLMFRKLVEDVTKAERKNAKKCVHALNYDMRAPTFAQQSGISLAEAKRCRALYFATFPKLDIWHREVAYRLTKSRTMCTPFGRKRLFLGQYSETLVKEALAFVPQSTVGDITTRGVRLLHDSLPTGASLALTVHDSITVDCAPEQVEEVIGLMQGALTYPLAINGRTCVIPIDFKVGSNWGDMHGIQ